MTIDWKTVLTTVVGGVILFGLHLIYQRVETIPLLDQRLTQIEKDIDRIKNTVQVDRKASKVVRLIEKE